MRHEPQMQSNLIIEHELLSRELGISTNGCKSFDKELRNLAKPRTLKRPVRTPIKGPRDL